MSAEIDAARKLATGARARADAATGGRWFREEYEDGEAGEGPTGVYPGARGPGREIVDARFAAFAI